MSKCRDDWGFGDFFNAARFGSGAWGFAGGEWSKRGGRSRRTQMFESGEMKFVILRLLREKPRHGYEIIKALEEKMGGCYTPSAGTVYPTLQLLEDQGFVRGVDTDGKKVYHITPEGEKFLDENRDVMEDIFERVRSTVRDFAGGPMGELNGAFMSLAGTTFKRAWRLGPDHPSIRRVTEILRRTAEEIEREWEGASQRTEV
jgi:DNA-binding PadR family transcriptional regulator